MNACLILALQELVRRETNSEPYVLGGKPWAARGEAWYARRLNVTTGRIKELLNSPEFEIFELTGSSYRMPIVRLRENSKSTPAHERQKLLREVFIDALSQWKRIEEVHLRMKLDETGDCNSAQTPDHSSYRLQRMKVSHRRATELLEADPNVGEYLRILSGAWNQHAPFVLRVAVDEWWNFLDIGEEMLKAHHALEWLPTFDLEVPDLETIALLPNLGLILALSRLDSDDAILTSAGIEEPAEEWIEDLEGALQVEQSRLEVRLSSLEEDEQGEDLEVDA